MPYLSTIDARFVNFPLCHMTMTVDSTPITVKVESAADTPTSHRTRQVFCPARYGRGELGFLSPWTVAGAGWTTCCWQRLLDRVLQWPQARRPSPAGSLARRRDRAGPAKSCGHDGQRKSVAHMRQQLTSDRRQPGTSRVPTKYPDSLVLPNGRASIESGLVCQQLPNRYRSFLTLPHLSTVNARLLIYLL
jgi:hypothetical protein